MTSLRARSWRSLLVLGVIMSAVLFGGAGTLRYWQSWIYLILFFGLATALTRDLLRRDPALLERRLKGGPTAETRPLQRLLMTGATVGFAGLLVIPALDVRWGRASVPAAGVVLGDILFAAGFAFAGRVYRENTYASATIGVAEGQRVISTGPYAIVRHPLYATSLLYLIGTPLALGSYRGYLSLAILLPFLISRLLDEERMLVRDLPGYVDYQKAVRYRLIPGIW